MRHRNHPLWWAFLVHRLSGLALALFLPLHFLALGLALDAAALDGFLAWTDHPLVKIAEFGLAFLLALHLFGGLRVMALEATGLSAGQKTMAAGAVGLSVFLSALFLMQAI